MLMLEHQCWIYSVWIISSTVFFWKFVDEWLNDMVMSWIPKLRLFYYFTRLGSFILPNIVIFHLTLRRDELVYESIWRISSLVIHCPITSGWHVCRQNRCYISIFDSSHNWKFCRLQDCRVSGFAKYILVNALIRCQLLKHYITCIIFS